MEQDRTHFICNKWMKGSGSFFSSLNPATGEEIWTGQSATETEVDQAVASAQKASSAFSKIPIEERIEKVKLFESLLKEHADEMGELIAKETGKALWEGKGEVAAMLGKIPISIRAHEERCRVIENQVGSALSITRHRPQGVVAIFGPFNFPGHLPNGHIVPALIAGNTIVFKPSELTPRTAERMISLWKEVDLPPGALNLVQGKAETGIALANHPGINGLFFTGSAETGKTLSKMFGEHPEKILALELGGNNPLVVSENIEDLQAAAYTTLQSAFITSGQRCTCARRLIVPKGEKGDRFLELLIQMTKEITIAPYQSNPEPFMGSVISQQSAQNLLDTQRDLLEKGGVSLLEMKRLEIGDAFVSPGMIDVTEAKGIPDKEAFGPLLQVVRVADLKEAIEEANNTAYGLSAGLLSDLREEYDQFFYGVRAGIINWNTPLTGASSSAPFGGVGVSGNHRPSAYYAADYCSYPVASMEIEKVQLPANPLPGTSF